MDCDRRIEIGKESRGQGRRSGHGFAELTARGMKARHLASFHTANRSAAPGQQARDGRRLGGEPHSKLLLVHSGLQEGSQPVPLKPPGVSRNKGPQTRLALSNHAQGRGLSLFLFFLACRISESMVGSL